MWQHDEIVNAWNTCLHEVKIHHEKESRHRYSGNENRPDIVVHDSGCSSDLAVAMAHPFSQNTLKQAALEEGFATARREERKMIKYEKQQLAGNTSSLNFTPLVFKHFETWGSEATNYLNKLARRSRDIEAYTNEADFRGFWRKKFSIILQQCNTRVILNKLTCVFPGEEDENIHNRDYQVVCIKLKLNSVDCLYLVLEM